MLHYLPKLYVEAAQLNLSSLPIIIKGSFFMSPQHVKQNCTLLLERLVSLSEISTVENGKCYNCLARLWQKHGFLASDGYWRHLVSDEA